MNILNMTELDMMVTNIVAKYYEGMMSPVVAKEGLNWYRDACNWCMTTAYEYDLTYRQVAGVVAALSPGNNWLRNKIDAVNCIVASRSFAGVDGFKSATYGKLNKEKAYRIAQGEDPLLVLRGDKVRSFYSNIVSPNGTEDVTVDGHAIHIALGITDEAIDKVPKMNAKLYVKLVEAYKQAAIKINSCSMAQAQVVPSQVQSVTWVIHRVRKGVARPEV